MKKNLLRYRKTTERSFEKPFNSTRNKTRLISRIGECITSKDALKQLQHEKASKKSEATENV